MESDIWDTIVKQGIQNWLTDTLEQWLGCPQSKPGDDWFVQISDLVEAVYCSPALVGVKEVLLRLAADTIIAREQEYRADQRDYYDMLYEKQIERRAKTKEGGEAND